MNKKLFVFIKSLITFSIALFLLTRLINGNIDLYINKRFNYLTILAVVCLLTMSILSIRSAFKHFPADNHHDQPGLHSHTQNWSELVILSLPLFFGLLVQVAPLSADMLDVRDVSLSSPAVFVEKNFILTLQSDADARDILDWLRAFEQKDAPETLEGSKANVIGFTYHDDQLGDDQVWISRYVMVCCAADAFPVGMVVDWQDAGELENNVWVQVQGSIKNITIDDVKIPALQAEQVDLIPTPEQPYIFP